MTLKAVSTRKLSHVFIIDNKCKATVVSLREFDNESKVFILTAIFLFIEGLYRRKNNE